MNNPDAHQLPAQLARPDGTDGSVETAQGPYPITWRPQLGALIRKPSATLTPQERQQRAQAFSVICHMSVLFGLPMFVIPMMKRDQAFSLHHAKASAINFIVFHVAMLASVIFHPYFLFALLVSYLPGWIGIWRAARGQRVGIFGFGPIGEAVFFMLPARAPVRGALESEQDSKLYLDAGSS